MNIQKFPTENEKIPRISTRHVDKTSAKPLSTGTQNTVFLRYRFYMWKSRVNFDMWNSIV